MHIVYNILYTIYNIQFVSSIAAPFSPRCVHVLPGVFGVNRGKVSNTPLFIRQWLNMREKRQQKKALPLKNRAFRTIDTCIWQKTAATGNTFLITPSCSPVKENHGIFLLTRAANESTAVFNESLVVATYTKYCDL
jgi:hypothetical protein